MAPVSQSENDLGSVVHGCTLTSYWLSLVCLALHSKIDRAVSPVSRLHRFIAQHRLGVGGFVLPILASLNQLLYDVEVASSSE
ncbi:hypothetical protein A0H81_11999 [Grifola frondosa]|uniref:Uncharacterized protein n=1 Tax=Grifola frondosa TaxID=5627 RepID=A0A1C7LVM6_GRIFR|nr:hypothetical protein A0H81_11999 [Grifola frondosa]